MSGATDAVVTPTAGGLFSSINTSTSWQIEDVRIIADIVTLDNGLQNSYAEHVLSGKSLPINYSTYISILQSCAFPMNVSVTRAVSRLKTVFFNFDGDHSTVTNAVTGVYKDWNSFQHPMQGTYSFNQEMEFQVQIGSKMFPEYPCRSLSQAFYELKKGSWDC